MELKREPACFIKPKSFQISCSMVTTLSLVRYSDYSVTVWELISFKLGSVSELTNTADILDPRTWPAGGVQMGRLLVSSSNCLTQINWFIVLIHLGESNLKIWTTNEQLNIEKYEWYAGSAYFGQIGTAELAALRSMAARNSNQVPDRYFFQPTCNLNYPMHFSQKKKGRADKTITLVVWQKGWRDALRNLAA